jgi:hypothetical protein
MQSLDVFLPRVLLKANGCSDPLARQAVLDSCIEFCEESHIVQFTSAPQPVVEGLMTYELDTPADQEVSATLRVWYGTRQLSPATPDQIDTILAYVDTAGGQTPPKGEPSVFFESSPGVIAIYPAPNQTAPSMFSARVASRPARIATTVEDILYKDWVEAIVAGALARICSVPNQFFSSDAVAARGAAEFRYGVNRASSIRRRGRVEASLSIRVRGLA